MSSVDDHLQSGIAAVLGGGERLQWTLTNRRTGVVREDAGGSGRDDETRRDRDETRRDRDGTRRDRDGDGGDDERERIEPAPDMGAVAAVTDQRVLFLVGGADDGRDDVVSIPHGEVAGVGTDTDLLARTLVVTTGNCATWRFTVRESGRLDDVIDDLTDRIAGDEHVLAALDRAREHREAAAAADDADRVAAAYDDAVEAYREAVELRTAPAVTADLDAAALKEEVVETVESAIESHLELARQRRSRGNWELAAGNDRAAVDHLSLALDGFERAHELASETPAGDPDAIAAERDDLLRKLDEVDMRTPVLTAEDD